MGRLFAVLFANAGADVVLVDYRPERASKLTEEGLTIRGLREKEIKSPIRVLVTTNPSEYAPYDVIFVCVKAYSTRSVAEQLSIWVKDTLIVTLQNGMGNLETLLDYFPNELVVGGTTSCGANIPQDSPNTVIFAGCGETLIGSPLKKWQKDGSLETVLRLFRQANLPLRVTDNLYGELWGKLLINAAVNPICGLLRIRNGMLPKIPSAWKLAELVLAEGVSVAKAEGIELPYPDAAAKVKSVCNATAQNRCSTLQDVENGRRTEIDYINGYICRTSEKHKIPTPYNLALTLLFDSLSADVSGKPRELSPFNCRFL